jgi:hypothetical protein
MSKEWRWGLLAFLVIFFPILFHPLWLLPATLAAFVVLVWLLLPKKDN